MNQESQEIKTRLLRAGLLMGESIDYLRFGKDSLVWIANKSKVDALRLRFDPYPNAMAVLQNWPQEHASDLRIICHWHVMLSDPLYRAFGNTLLYRETDHFLVHTQGIANWIALHYPDRWETSVMRVIARALKRIAMEAGLIDGAFSEIQSPYVSDLALEYLLYLLREVEHEGGLLENPYFRSLNLDGYRLDTRLRKLKSIRFGRQGENIDIEWQYPDLISWSQSNLGGV